MGPATPHTVRLILDIVPSLPDTPSASDEHQCTTVVQGGTLRHSLFLYISTKIKHPSLQKHLNINNGTS